MATLDRTEADLERVRAAIAEAGYPPEHVTWAPEVERTAIAFTAWAIPAYVSWKAMAINGLARACWPCVRERARLDTPAVRCDHPIDPFCPESEAAA